MSQFSYNGVVLTYVRTLRFRIDDEKDPSGVDQLWRKYSLSVSGVVSGGTEITDGPASLAALQEQLTTPRKPLIYVMGGATIINTTGVDARYGPDTPTVEVTQVVPGVIFATVDVTVRIAACANNPGSNEIASLRWSQEEDVDEEEWLTTVTTRGLLISRTDLRLLNADSFREALPIPLPPQNFTRKAHYRLDETGTKLQFEFRDREWYKLPPMDTKCGATGASGTFAVTSNKGGGIRHAIANVTLKGGPGTSRVDLMSLAFTVAFTKIKKAGPQKDKDTGRIVLEYVLTEDLYRNLVSVSARATLGATTMDVLQTAASSLFGTSPGSDDTAAQQTSFGPPTRLALAGLLSAAFKDPCAASYIQRQSQAGSLGSQPQQYPPAGFSTGPVSSSGTDQPSPSYKKDEGGYEWYKVESTYHWDEGVGMLPATGVGSQSTSRKAKFVQVHGGMMTLEVAWSFRRPGKPGVYPAYETGDPNVRKLAAVITMPQQDVSGDDNPVFEASGVYRYGIENPDLVQMLAPRPPYLSDLVAQAVALTLKYPAQSISTPGGSGTSGGSAPGLPPVDPGSGGPSGSGPNPVTGTGTTTTPPDDSLSTQLTAAEEAYIEQLVQGGANRATVTGLVQQGLIGPLSGGGSAPGIPPSGG